MKNKELFKVLLAMALAVAAGLATGPKQEIFGVPVLSIYSLIGQLFLNALTLVVVPLVASSIITGAARLGKEEGFGRLGFSTFFFFFPDNPACCADRGLDSGCGFSRKHN